MKRKGISLPVEMIVIIALAVIVLLAIGAFFAGGILNPTTQSADVNAWASGCGMMKLRGCILTDFTANLDTLTVAGYDVNKDGVDESAFTACKRATGYSTVADCHIDCCLAGTAGGTGDRGRGR